MSNLLTNSTSKILALLPTPIILNISLESDIIYVNPIPTLNRLEQPLTSIDSNDTINGTLLLFLPQKKSIKRITVVLEGICDAYAGYATKYESSTTLRKELVLNLKSDSEQTLSPGTHAFKFSFIIPSNTSVFERSTFGRVRHSIKSFVEFKSKLTKDVSSSSVSIWITNNPLGPGSSEIPEGLNSVIEFNSESLGPITATFSSPHLSIASLLQLDVLLSNPPSSSNIKIIAIESYIKQSFDIHYDNGKVLHPHSRRHALELVLVRNSSSPSSSPLAKPFLATLSPGVEFSHSLTLRLPGEDILRPSTLEGTDTRIKVFHRLILVFRYRLDSEDGEEGEEKLLVLSKGVMITSCGCLLDSLLLPSYQKDPIQSFLTPSSSPSSPSPTPVANFNTATSNGTRNQIQNLQPRFNGRERCVCDLSLEELIRGLQLSSSTLSSGSTDSNGSSNNEGAGVLESFRRPLTFDSRIYSRNRIREGIEAEGEKSPGILNRNMRLPPQYYES